MSRPIRSAACPARSAFTLIELLVVVSIIVLLLALLVPALSKALEAAQIAVCGAHQSGIAKNVTRYAMEQKSRRVPPTKNSTEPFRSQGIFAVTNCFRHNETNDGLMLQEAGLTFGEELFVNASQPDNTGIQDGRPTSAKLLAAPSEIMSCPSRDMEPTWEENNDPNFGVVSGQVDQFADWQLIHAFNYFGNMGSWNNHDGIFPAASPKDLKTSKGSWALTADFTKKESGPTGSWYQGPDSGRNRNGEAPPHRGSDGDAPAGHNQSFMDGSVQWIDVQQMYFIHTWQSGAQGNTSVRRKQFWYQQDLGSFRPSEQSSAKFYLQKP